MLKFSTRINNCRNHYTAHTIVSVDRRGNSCVWDDNSVLSKLGRLHKTYFGKKESYKIYSENENRLLQVIVLYKFQIVLDNYARDLVIHLSKKLQITNWFYLFIWMNIQNLLDPEVVILHYSTNSVIHL